MVFFMEEVSKMRNQELIEKHIEVIPGVQHGRPCIKGRRIPVYVILEALATGMDVEAIKKEFAPITTEDINACILYAALLADEQELIPQAI
jgi:uncharacterized protein (DUF433 family)